MKVVIRAIGRFFSEADIVLLVLSIVSAVFGIILINSVVRHFVPAGNQVAVQAGAIVIGLGLFILFSYVDIDIIADKSVFLLIFSVLFISTLAIWGAEEGGNRAWLRFGEIGVQPAEVVKVPFIIIIAKMITNFKERKTLNNFLSLMQIMLVFLVLFGLILGVSDDLGSALVYAFILLVMLFIGGVKLRWFLIGGVVVAAVFPFFWTEYLPVRQQARVLAPFPFFHDMLEPGMIEDVMWQANRSVTAISSGGFFGRGLGNGYFTQPGRIPALHTDFIFAVAGEELGFVGCLMVVALLVLIIVRCIYVGARSNNPLGMMVCTGISAMLIAHTVENIGMTLAILPVIGITLPFFSYGGSAIVTCFAAMGIVSGIKMRPKPVRFRSL